VNRGRQVFRGQGEGEGGEDGVGGEDEERRWGVKRGVLYREVIQRQR